MEYISSKLVFILQTILEKIQTPERKLLEYSINRLNVELAKVAF